MKYEDYVDLKHRPSKKDLICDFFVEPMGKNLKRAAGGIAAESSIGTWTETTTTKKYVEKLAATVFEMKGNNIKIAYPSILEQRQILCYIYKSTKNIHKLISRAEREIELIQEYRTRLISDVVTGKVDVRDITVEDVVDEELEEEVDLLEEVEDVADDIEEEADEY